MKVYSVYKSTDFSDMCVGTYGKKRYAEQYIRDQLRSERSYAKDEGTDCSISKIPNSDVYIVSYTITDVLKCKHWCTVIYRIRENLVLG